MARRRRYRIHHPARFAVSLAVLASLAIAAFVFWPSAEDTNPLAEAAGPPCQRACDSPRPVVWQFPLSEADRAAFAEDAAEVTEEAQLIDQYTSNRSIPLTATAYIPTAATNPANNALYYEDGNQIFIPAVLLPPNDPGTLAKALSDDGASARKIVLGFDRTRVPADVRFLKIYGYLWWETSGLYPTAKTDLLPEPAPIIQVGAWETVDESQLRAPAVRSVEPKFIIRQRDLQISIDRIDFSPPSETRVRVTLKNLSRQGQPVSWSASGLTLITADGAELTPVDAPGSSTSTDAGNSGALDPNDIPASGTVEGVDRSGYVFFRSISPNEAVSINIPDLSGSSQIGANGALADSARLFIPSPESK